VEAEVDGWHTEETPFGVHNTVIVGEGQGAGAAESVARKQSDCRKGVVEQCRQELA
jgi:hypothetical protein